MATVAMAAEWLFESELAKTPLRGTKVKKRRCVSDRRPRKRASRGRNAINSPSHTHSNEGDQDARPEGEEDSLAVDSLSDEDTADLNGPGPHAERGKEGRKEVRGRSAVGSGRRGEGNASKIELRGTNEIPAPIPVWVVALVIPTMVRTTV